MPAAKGIMPKIHLFTGRFSCLNLLGQNYLYQKGTTKYFCTPAVLLAQAKSWKPLLLPALTTPSSFTTPTFIQKKSIYCVKKKIFVLLKNTMCLSWMRITTETIGLSARKAWKTNPNAAFVALCVLICVLSVPLCMPTKTVLMLLEIGRASCRESVD